MARSKHATRTKASKPPLVVKPAWPTTESNMNNFLLPSNCTISKELILEILGRIPCRYTHKDYMLTARILLQLEKQGEDELHTPDASASQDFSEGSKMSADIDGDAKKPQGRAKTKTGAHDSRLKRFGTRTCMRRCIYLSTLTIKYSAIMRQLFDLSDFFNVHPDLRDDITLVRVIFCDFLDRSLELRLPFPNEELHERCTLIENAIKDMHIRICAEFARMRIKLRSPTLLDMLEEKVKELDKAMRKMPLYAWVNQLLITIPKAIDLLRAAGFSYCPTPSIRGPLRSNFQPDLHCPDILVFNRLDADDLDSNHAFKKHKLNFGDKLECLALHLLIEKCNPKTSITLVNPNSTSYAVHCESLYVAKHGKESVKGRKLIRVILIGTPMKSVDDELQRLGESGATSILINEDVVNAGKWPATDLVLVYGCSSMTGIIDPLEYLMFSERCDSAMLYSVLEYNNNPVLDTQTPVFLRTNLECLKHSFEIPGIQSAVFLAHSIRSAETSQLLQKSIDMANHRSQNTTGLAWGMINPVNDSFKKTEYIGLTEKKDGIFVSPSKECNGGFIAMIERQLIKLDAVPITKEETKKPSKSSGLNVNNKYRSSRGGSGKQQNMHNRAKPRQEKKRMASQRLARSLKDQPSLCSALAKRRHDKDDGATSSTESDDDGLKVLELSAVGAEF